MAKTKRDWQRARSPEQKEERARTILEAAGELLDTEGLEGTGLNAIARQCGLSKPNLYVYFESREAILLRLLQDEVQSWSKALTRKLAPLEGKSDVAAVAEAFANTLARRKRLCLLLSSLAGVFEHNVSAESVAAFKRDFLENSQPCVGALSRALPKLDEEQAFQALGTLMMSAMGIWPHCYPSPAVQEVLARPEFSAYKHEFKESVRDLADAYLRGRLARPD